MKRSILRSSLTVLLAVLLVSLLAACGGFSNASGGSSGTGANSVRVINNTGTRICFLLASSSTSQSWGEDLLGQSSVLENNGEFTVRFEQAGTYDLMAVLQSADGTCNGQNGQTVTNMGIDITGDVTWTVTPQ
ncbi:MAG: hypothetical protein U0670_05485 [Anaerolineae bacterium]